MRLFFFFKQKTAYEMRISDWSSDVCSSDLPLIVVAVVAALAVGAFLGLLLRRQAPRESPEIAALTGRLSQMAESQTAVQNAIIERLQAQERVVVKTDRKSTRLNSSH